MPTFSSLRKGQWFRLSPGAAAPRWGQADYEGAFKKTSYHLLSWRANARQVNNNFAVVFKPDCPVEPIELDTIYFP